MIIQSPGAPKHFIVFLPGMFGSMLRARKTGRNLWADFNSLPVKPSEWDEWFFEVMDALKYPNDDLQAVGLVDDLQFLLPWVKQTPYRPLIQALQAMGYKVNPKRYQESDRDLYTFPYDWRQDHRVSARQLQTAIERWRSTHPGAEVWLIGHGAGGLVARWYIEKLGGSQEVGRLILFATPWDGAPMALGIIKYGLDTLWRRTFNAADAKGESQRLLQTFPSIYALVPQQQPFLLDQHSEVIDPFENDTWLESERSRTLLADGKEFSQALALESSVETLCFYGRQRLTVSNATVHIGQNNVWDDIEWWSTEIGDGTVPAASATLADATDHLPFVASHGDIYANESALAVLRWELFDKYRGLSRAMLATSRLAMTFEPDKDFYEPGESIQLWATVHKEHPESVTVPATDARIAVELASYRSLPGAMGLAKPRAIPGTNMRPDPEMEGRYRGTLTAPLVEGYYKLFARVFATGQRPLQIEELIAVEAMLAG